MEPQNYANHPRYVKGYHYLLSTLLFIGLIAAIVNIYRHIHFEALLSCILILLLFICAFIMAWFLRVFPLKAQDRAIRAEESLRYYILGGKQIDKRLTISQIVALRFADDDEFIALADKAATEGMAAKDIKLAIKNWRADNHRA